MPYFKYAFLLNSIIESDPNPNVLYFAGGICVGFLIVCLFVLFIIAMIKKGGG
jgi:hypothetical protein